jgi:hypothetical protein
MSSINFGKLASASSKVQRSIVVAGPYLAYTSPSNFKTLVDQVIYLYLLESIRQGLRADPCVDTSGEENGQLHIPKVHCLFHCNCCVISTHSPTLGP